MDSSSGESDRGGRSRAPALRSPLQPITGVSPPGRTEIPIVITRRRLGVAAPLRSPDVLAPRYRIRRDPRRTAGRCRSRSRIRCGCGSADEQERQRRVPGAEAERILESAGAASRMISTPPLTSNVLRAPGAPCAMRLESATDQLRLITDADERDARRRRRGGSPPLIVVGSGTVPIVRRRQAATCPTPVESRSTVTAPSCRNAAGQLDAVHRLPDHADRDAGAAVRQLGRFCGDVIGGVFPEAARRQAVRSGEEVKRRADGETCDSTRPRATDPEIVDAAARRQRVVHRRSARRAATPTPSLTTVKSRSV